MRKVLGELLQDDVKTCTGCPLSNSRKKAVPFQGPDDYEPRAVVFVGEAPGGEEDEQGVPFVGPAGTLLRGVLNEVGFHPYDFYITNIIGCRPPQNKFDIAEQVGAPEACRGHLNAAIVFSGAWLVVALGNTAYRALAPTVEGSIGQVRGKPRMRTPTQVILPTWHPAYALRTRKARGDMLEDLEPWLAAPLMEPRSSSEHLIRDMWSHPEDVGVLLPLWYEARDAERKGLPDPFSAPVQGRLL